MRKLIFLDVDGVLNSHITNYVDRTTDLDFSDHRALDARLVAVLERIQQEHDPEWVLSSAWRYHTTPARMTLYLAHHGFTGTVIDSTPIWHTARRGAQIHKWLEDTDNLDRPFLILDDSCDMEPYGAHLVQTSGVRGLQAHHLAAVRRTFDWLAARGVPKGHGNGT